MNGGLGIVLLVGIVIVIVCLGLVWGKIESGSIKTKSATSKALRITAIIILVLGTIGTIALCGAFENFLYLISFIPVLAMGLIMLGVAKCIDLLENLQDKS